MTELGSGRRLQAEQCRGMQARVAQLIATVQDESVLCLACGLNDDLNRQIQVEPAKCRNRNRRASRGLMVSGYSEERFVLRESALAICR